jgi:glycosyltransferase involved in cell wall biosynthesis
MKIAVIAPTHLPAQRANTIQVMKMTQALAEIGNQVRLAVPGLPANAHSVPWETLARQYGLQQDFLVEWLPVWPALRSYDFGYRAIAWARRWQADLLYTRLPQAAALSSWLGMPVIYETHDFPRGTLGPWALRLFLKGRGARRLVIITQALLRDLQQSFALPAAPSFTRVAPDGVDLERYNDLPGPEQARQKLMQSSLDSTLAVLQAGDIQTLKSAGFVAGYTGHLYPGRGAGLLLALAEKLPDIVFLLVGGEPQDVRAYASKVRTHGLNNVILTGFVPNSQLPLYQAACDALLMPYQHRVAASSGGDIARYLSPMKVFEYMAAGRPILSSDLPVLKEILSPQNALLLPAQDTPAWAAALHSLQTDPDHGRLLAEQARQDVQHYTWKRRAEIILEGL